MNRLEQDAADVLAWHERQQRHKQGYGPRPVEPIGESWKPPPLTPAQQQEHQQYVKRHSCPF